MLASLLALWAGLSRRPWWLRLLAVAAGGVGLMVAGVYEGVVFLLRHCLSVFAVLVLFRWSLPRRRPSGPTAVGTPAGRSRWRVRFGLRDLLLLNLVTGAFAAELTYAVAHAAGAQWSCVIVTATSASGVACAIAWFGAARSWRVLPLGLALLAAVLHKAVWGWAARQSFLANVLVLRPGDVLLLLWDFVWIQVALLLAFAVLYRLSVGSVTKARTCAGPRSTGWVTRVARFVLGLLAISVVVPVLLLAWGLSRPFPPIEVWPEEENSYPELMAAAARVDVFSLPDPITASEAALQAFAKQNAATAASLRALLGRPSRVPLEYTPLSQSPGGGARVDQGTPRPVAELLRACGRGEAAAGNPPEATNLYVDVVRLGRQASRGGLLHHRLACFGIEEIGMLELSALRTGLSAAQVRELRPRLWTLWEAEADREPLAVALARDDNWSWRVHGWSVRFSVLLDEPFAAWFASTRPYRPGYLDKVAAACRADLALLFTDLALREYRFAHGNYPADLDELVPQYLPAVLSDPFAGNRLVYRRQAETFVLYSVGGNGRDNGGQAASRWDMVAGDGDFLLDRPDSIASQQPAASR